MEAPGYPGISPRWTSSAKDGVGTAISAESAVWFTISHGILNEIYFPRMDQANVRDAEFLIVGPDGKFWEEKRDLTHHLEFISPHAPAYQYVNADPSGRFRLIKRIVTWPGSHALMQQVRLEVLKGNPEDYRVFFLVAPHMANQGAHNSASLIDLRGRPALMAWRANTYLCVASTAPLRQMSVGFVGTSDGWTLLHNEGRLDIYDSALDGNVAMTAELEGVAEVEQTLVMAFGRNEAEARFTAELALLHDYSAVERDYIAQWEEYMAALPGLVPPAHPHSFLQRVSAMVLKTHHGKLFPGGIIASLSIPWGNAAGDGDLGGYHLVWPRDMVEAAQAFLALGDGKSAREALLFLMATQRQDGSWAQNFWLDGTPFWQGSQLDETAFPLHLAYHLQRANMLHPEDDVYPMVKKALGYLARTGPVTQQDRWEEDGGYSPSTLAAVIAGLLLGADLAREQHDVLGAEYAEQLADYWQQEIDLWTFTTHGMVDPAYSQYYIRIHTPDSDDPGYPRLQGAVTIKNQPWRAPTQYPEDTIIDGGFLELVRYGLKSPRDPHILESVAAYDAVLQTELPYGPLWHRYNHDGYGNQADGAPFQGSGIGRLWPLLAGERGHYAIADGQDAERYLQAMEGAASAGGLLPEQTWDQADIPGADLFYGRPAGSAMPLVWAHAEYIKLIRSAADNRVFETPALVADRYLLDGNTTRVRRVFWQPNHQRKTWRGEDAILRIAVPAPADLIYTTDQWQTTLHASLQDSGLGMYFFDISLEHIQTVEFTFFWRQDQRWEGRNYQMIRQAT